jgi:2-hydroxychromene-2-carboxylate isomerase
MGAPLDFFFFYGSIHSYLSVMRIEGLAAAAGIGVRWRPFNLREILIEQNNTGFVNNDVKMNYFWRDLERRARRHNIPFAGRAPYPADPELLALRVGLIAAQEGWCAEYSRATFCQWFIGQRTPGSADHVEEVLMSLGQPIVHLVERGRGAEGKELMNEATSAARKLGIFGAPTFASGQEIFWGDDRLEEAIAFAAGQSMA